MTPATDRSGVGQENPKVWFLSAKSPRRCGPRYELFFFHPPNSPNLYCGWYRRPYYGARRPNLSMILCTHRAQGVLVTKMELWIPPSSSYVSNVTARLRENRLYAGWATLACPGGFWGSLYVLWMVYEVNKQVPSIKQHGRCIRACGGAIP